MKIIKERKHNITCPKCGYIILHSLERPDNGTEICVECSSEYKYQRHSTVTYDSWTKVGAHD